MPREDTEGSRLTKVVADVADVADNAGGGIETLEMAEPTTSPAVDLSDIATGSGLVVAASRKPSKQLSTNPFVISMESSETSEEAAYEAEEHDDTTMIKVSKMIKEGLKPRKKADKKNATLLMQLLEFVQKRTNIIFTLILMLIIVFFMNNQTFKLETFLSTLLPSYKEQFAAIANFICNNGTKSIS